jgi:hypothetical protein
MRRAGVSSELMGQRICLACLLLAVTARGEEARPPEPLVAASPSNPSLNLLLTQSELRSIVRRYETEHNVSFDGPAYDDEVVVTATGELAPMRDVARDAWGGIAAPFWAIMNPKDAWRIFAPIPGKPDNR